MFCYVNKQRITSHRFHTRWMSKMPINAVLAANLRYFMTARGITAQTALAASAGVAQRTVSNYLNPANRTESATGKAPSAKLSELESIAKALNVEVWELLRPMSEADRLIYQKVEEAFAGVRALASDSSSTSHSVHESGKRYGTGG